MNLELIFYIIFTAIASGIIGFIIGVSVEHEDFAKCLVKSGHAEYYLDKNNQRQWRMKK